MDREHIASLINTALGVEKADLVIVNGTLVNVYTGEVQENMGVAIKGERIAYVGPTAEHTIGPNTEVLDVRGKVLAPGFIDGHAHIDNLYTVSEILRYAMVTGTTTIITETSEIGGAIGYAGVVQMIENIKDQPVLLWAVTPSELPINPEFEDCAAPFSAQQAEELLRRSDVLGVGEAYWPRVVESDPTVLDIIAGGLKAFKPVAGHSSGAGGNKLQAYVAAGIASCHEPITVDEAVERLRLGMYVLIREGSLRQDLEAIAPIKDLDVDFRRLGLTTDGLWPGDVIENGFINRLVQKAIDLGFAPVTAIQMATLNVAELFGLDMLVGGIAPHRYANINVLPDIRTMTPDYVIAKGRIVAAQGELLVSPRKDYFPPEMMQTVHLPRRMSAEDFHIKAPASRVKARVLKVIKQMVVGEVQMDIAAPDGVILADPANDILKATVINRHDGRGEKFVGLINGFGLKAGAFATTISWDSDNIVAVGASEADMAAAINRIAELQGGTVLCENGVIYEELAHPVGGIISQAPLEEIAARLKRIDARLRELGSTPADPFLTLQTLTFTALLFTRMTEKGLVDVRQKKIVDLFVN
ncbi:MAG: adenine deaminase [Chloroflexi bacterium]|nr:adenine deaminase [Chloroflexota bacterium]